MEGVLPIILAAVNIGHLIRNSPTRNAIPNVTGRTESVEVKHIDHSKSCQLSKNANIKVATIPGTAKGIEMRKTACNLEHPSIIADSSKSLESVSKKPFIIQLQKGREMAIKAIIKLVRVLYNPNLLIILKYGPISSTPEIICVAKKAPIRNLRPLNKNLEKP